MTLEQKLEKLQLEDKITLEGANEIKEFIADLLQAQQSLIAKEAEQFFLKLPLMLEEKKEVV